MTGTGAAARRRWSRGSRLVVAGLGLVLAVPVGAAGAARADVAGAAVVAAGHGSCGPMSSACGGSDNVDKTLYATYDAGDDAVELRQHTAVNKEDPPSSDPNAPRYAYTTVPACMGYNDPNTGFNDALCMGATANPLCRKGEIYVEIWRRQIAPVDDPVWHPTPDRTCIGSRVVRRIPRSELTADVRGELEKHVPAPAPRVDPSGTTLVNMPVVVSTPEQGAVTLAVPQVPGSSVTASPSYAWDFAGEARAEGAGRPYDGTDPVAHPDHYVSHAFASAGTRTVTLETSWAAVFVVDGVRLDLDPITFTTDRAVPVREAAAHLVSGGS